MPLLEGHVGKQSDEKYDRVLRDLQLARQLVADKEAELVKLRGEYQRLMTAVQYLREQLEPLHIGLSAIFGQIDLVSDGIPQSSTRAAAHPPTAAAGANPKWESWKHKFPGKPAEFIDLLLVHEEMTTNQLMVAVKCGRQTVYDNMSKLGRAGLVDNNGGKYRLREI